MKKNFNIAIVGLGNIGSFLFNYLKKNNSSLSRKSNVTSKIYCVSAKSRIKKRKIKLGNVKWISNCIDITKDPKIDVIIELIGGAEGIAKKLVFESLKRKKHVITANKALIAKYGDQLSRIAEKNKVNLEFEAAVCGGLPIVRSVKESLVANKISKFYGIFNGTSNYILSSMSHNRMDFKQSLNKAKLLGYAEANPLSDLNGEDVSSKVKILSSLCFNSFLNSKIHVEGIKNIDREDIINAENLGYKIKLLGTAYINNNRICQRVYPVLINKNSYIAGINGVLNAVVIEGKPIGQSIIQGEGAGPEATTSAIVSDLSSIYRGNIKHPFGVSFRDRRKIKDYDLNNTYFSAYIRLEVKDIKGVLSNVTKVFSINKVSIKRLIQNPFNSKKSSSIIIISHKSKNLFLLKTIKQLSNKNYIIKKPKLIRIDDL
tara:strand:+ start:1825 stop:3114 length:1290 start_codon:yes stop_codon:yes gene_type:complete